MSSGITLKGAAWDHPRGYEPLVACSRIWRERSGIEVVWDRRSLQEFESYPLGQLAHDYDLMVIDHPHIGEAVAAGCLVPLGRQEHGDAADSASPSYASYAWQGRQWALPVDAATQVQAWRPDLIEQPASNWNTVIGLAREGRVACPLRPPHSLMTLLALANNLGPSCGTAGTMLIDPGTGADAVEMLRELTAFIDPASFALDPIAVLEAMARGDTPIACAPWIYGYVSYARLGFRPQRLAFSDVPELGDAGPVGTVLGGAGVAVSAFGRRIPEAVRFAEWVCSADVQAGPYASAGGQPAHTAAWSNAAVNEPVADFYRATRSTLDGAWVRPRHNGYVAFQSKAAEWLNTELHSGANAAAVVATLNALYRASLTRDMHHA